MDRHAHQTLAFHTFGNTPLSPLIVVQATTFILAAHETLDPNADGSVFFKHNLGQATATVALTTSNDDPASAGNTTWCEDSGANLFCLSWVIQGESIVFTIVYELGVITEGGGCNVLGCCRLQGGATATNIIC